MEPPGLAAQAPGPPRSGRILPPRAPQKEKGSWPASGAHKSVPGPPRPAPAPAPAPASLPRQPVRFHFRQDSGGSQPPLQIQASFPSPSCRLAAAPQFCGTPSLVGGAGNDPKVASESRLPRPDASSVPETFPGPHPLPRPGCAPAPRGRPHPSGPTGARAAFPAHPAAPRRRPRVLPAPARALGWAQGPHSPISPSSSSSSSSCSRSSRTFLVIMGMSPAEGGSELGAKSGPRGPRRRGAGGPGRAPGRGARRACHRGSGAVRSARLGKPCRGAGH